MRLSLYLRPDLRYDILFQYKLREKIPGSWCEPIPGRAQDVQGIKFQKDGKASSINMATL